MTFYVGQKVVCVNDAIEPWRVPWKLPKKPNLGGLSKGVVYSVRRVGLYRGVRCLWLAEIVRPEYAPGYGEVGFGQHRFRPLVEKGTDKGVALLKKIAEGTKQPVSIRHPEGVV